MVEVSRRSSGVFLRLELTAPWAVASPGARECAEVLCPEANRVVLFHVVLEGRCEIRLPSGGKALLGSCEAVVVPHGQSHVLGAHGHAWPAPVPQHLSPPPWNSVPVMRLGGGGEAASILSGYVDCQDLLFRPFLSSLPPLLHVRRDRASEWVHAARAPAHHPPAATALRLPELVLADALRQHAEAQASGAAGWLAALHDPVVVRALSLLHDAPGVHWSAWRLARAAGVRRRVLRDRFSAALGAKPLSYLGEWRIQLAARLLRASSATLLEIAGRVGYDDEKAFARAFERAVGVSPAGWRRSSAPAGRPADPEDGDRWPTGA